MSISFRPAVRDETSLLVAFAGASGSGKTFSALRFATGLAGEDGRIAVIDTEAGRALHYADRFRFDHGEIAAPFTPEAYQDAILGAEKAGYRVIVVDSFSHEYEGEGGLQDIQQADLERMAGGDVRKMERLTAPAWKNAKLRHKKMVSRLLQCRAHLVFCLRADEKIRFEKVKDERGFERTAIVPAGWVPICEKRWPYEMTLSVTMTPDAPGRPLFDAEGRPVHGKMQEQHRHAFPSGGFITEESGRLLAAWARGESGMAAASSPAAAPEAGGGEADAPSSAYLAYARGVIEDATDAGELRAWWGSDMQRQQRRGAGVTQAEVEALVAAIRVRLAEMEAPTRHGEDGG